MERQEFFGVQSTDIRQGAELLEQMRQLAAASGLPRDVIAAVFTIAAAMSSPDLCHDCFMDVCGDLWTAVHPEGVANCNTLVHK